MAGLVYQPLPPFTSVFNSALQGTLARGLVPPDTNSIGFFSFSTTPIEKVMANKMAKMEAMIQRIPGVPTPLKKSQPHWYINYPFIDSIALVEMPKKFSFPIMKLYDGTTDPTYHIASYKQCMFIVAIPRELREVYMCKSFGSSLMGPAFSWYTNL